MLPICVWGNISDTIVTVTPGTALTTSAGSTRPKAASVRGPRRRPKAVVRFLECKHRRLRSTSELTIDVAGIETPRI